MQSFAVVLSLNSVSSQEDIFSKILIIFSFFFSSHFSFFQTALHWGAKHGKKEMIKLVADRKGVDINVRSVRQ